MKLKGRTYKQLDEKKQKREKIGRRKVGEINLKKKKEKELSKKGIKWNLKM